MVAVVAEVLFNKLEAVGHLQGGLLQPTRPKKRYYLQWV